jgi:hypothetical protein
LLECHSSRWIGSHEISAGVNRGGGSGFGSHDGEGIMQFDLAMTRWFAALKV